MACFYGTLALSGSTLCLHSDNRTIDEVIVFLTLRDRLVNFTCARKSRKGEIDKTLKMLREDVSDRENTEPSNNLFFK